VIDLNTIWFFLVSILIVGYAILDGFDLGVGCLHLLAGDDKERRIFMNSIGPVWDGNEVWLLTGGGALFAAFPVVYATVFSSFYLAFMLLLFALIFRAVSFEFRGKEKASSWRKSWDWAFFLGSLIPSILFGVSIGNIMRGIPIDSSGIFRGSFLDLLNPYSLLVGLVSLTMFIWHGANYLTIKTESDLQIRAKKWARNGWLVFLILYVIVTVITIFVSPSLFEGLLSKVYFWIILIITLSGIFFSPYFLKQDMFNKAFFCSSLAIIGVIGLLAVSLFPNLVPSSIDLSYSLNIYNAASTPRTQFTMLIIALIGMPFVICYTIYIYRQFKGKVEITEESY
jgi:cytochrome d ubiquinol oxidase subunit II